MNRYFDFSDKTVIVAGAASGIGAATAHEFARCGARVFILDVDEQAQNVAQEIGGQFFPIDVSNENAVQNFIDSLDSLDVLVNNAAVLRPEKPIQETTTEEFDLLMCVNVRGTFLLCRAAYPLLKKVAVVS